ncbi:MAG TPA: peptidylprolyl isomerase [Paracoccaceae bacterium]|nr:peptidylprolyl isomerase [Paracoccaceae bacterium]
MRLKHLIAAAALVAGSGLAGVAPPAGAQTPFRPVAVVNDSAITGFDLAQRAQILMALGYPEARPDALRSAALDQLVDEELKLQAAREMGIEITPEMVQSGIDQFAERAGMQTDAFRALLSSQGVSDQALEDMARAEMGWLEVVRARFADSVMPGEAEVEAELALLDDRVATEYRVLEIGLPIEGAGRTEAETRALAEQLSRSLSSGGSFEEAVARYSSAPSAARGGQVGWVSTGRMPPDLARALQGLEIGEVSPPLEVAGGLTIIKVADKRVSTRDPQADGAAREAVRNQLISERSARLAQGLLQEMRRDALIEVR